MSKVFISYEFRDSITKPTVDNWRQQGIGTDISFISIPNIPNQPKLGKKKLRKIIYSEILKADIVMVLVSGDTHSKQWMLYEIRVAQCFRKKLFWCSIHDTKPRLPPELKHVKQVEAELEKVQTAIRQYQKEIQLKQTKKS